MNNITKTFALSVLTLSGAMMANGAVTAFYTDSGVGVTDTANAQTWGTGHDTNSVAFELTIDFTSAIDAITNPITLLDIGGNGTGSGIVLDGNNLSFFTGTSASTRFITTGLHGLSAETTGVQIVATFEREGGATAGEELLQLYVNGSLISSVEGATGNDWAGGDNSALGTVFGNAQAENFTFSSGTIVDYSGPISLNAYWLASDGGPTDNTLANIAVPEPSSFALLSGIFALGWIMLRRR